MTDNLLTATMPKNTPAVPEKFLDPETGEVRVDALVNSYLELEKKFSQRPQAPNSPEAYCIDCSHGLFTPDADINARLHALGFTPAQAQAVYDLAAERLVPLIVELAGEFQADREVERLVEQFGGPEKWREVSRQLLAFGKKSLPPGVLEGLSSSYEGVMALYRMMKADGSGMSSRAEPKPDMAAENDLRSMMRDPRYWREKDPSFVAKVTEGFKNLYGG